MNTTSLIGRFTKEHEIRYSQGATPIAVLRNSLAVNRRFKKQGEADADFINILAFGKQAELLEKYTGKGQQVAIEGHIQTGSYENAEKKRVYTFEVVVDSVTLLGSKSDTGVTPIPQQVNQATEDLDDLPF